VVFTLIFCSNDAKGQAPFYRNYTVEDGLASSTVYSMHQDKAGFLWFCTESGVSKFDGVLFRNFGRAEGLGDNEIFHCYEDKQDRIWFFPFNGRLSYYQKGKIYNRKSDTLLLNLEISSVFSKPFEDQSGALWVGTQRDSVIIWYSDKKSAKVKVGHRNVQVLDVDQKQITYHINSRKFVYALEFQQGIPSIGKLISDEEYAVVVDTLPQIGEYQISSFLKDKESNKWYTTMGDGVLMRSRTYVDFLDKDHGLDYDNVYSIANMLDSSLLTGFQNGTLQMWRKEQSIKTVLGEKAYNRIIDLFIDEYLWVASDRGLYALDKNDLTQIKHIGGSIKCLAQQGGFLYFGTSDGAYRVSLSNPDTTEKIFNERTISMSVVDNEFIYLGTNKGLMVYRKGEIINRSEDHQVLSGRIRAMCPLGKGTMLMGTHGEGILIIHEDQYFTLNMDNGLSSNICQTLFKENDSIVWVGTNNGLNKLKFHNKEYSNPIIDVYKISDGLRSNFINDIYVSNSRVYVASDKGVSFFNIQNYRGQTKPKAYIFKISINDQDTSLESFYGLKYFQNKIQIYYSGIAFESGKNTKFRYRVLGIDSVWRTTAQRELLFQALPPGKYKFELKAVATDGSQSDETTGFEFHISKPFWKTIWFIAGMICLLLFVAWRVNRFLIDYNHRKDVEERNKALQEKNDVIEFERERSDQLLLNILPKDTALELKDFGKVKAKLHEHATVMFSDFEGFTQLSSQVSPEELVHELDYCFQAFDRIIEKYNLEKVKTIGDAYMCAAGLNKDTSSDPADVVKASLDIMAFMEKYHSERLAQSKPFFKARIGIHSGKVVSGVVGIKKFAFDIWGDTVNTAARMESSGEVGKLNISKATYELVADQFSCTHRGKIAAKGKGEMDMYFVDRKG
jgi:class 3 adenylate cyclase/ligand-binding sensor domain-containing protein